MKRYGNLFEQITAIENIYDAYRKARRGRGWQDTIKNFNKNLDENLNNIQQSLINKTFTTSEYRTRLIYEPKQRTIYILPFAPDRIVQHALMSIVAPIWDRMFIHDSYACRVGKGMHRASKKTMEYVRRNKYCLQCDISKFYPSIDHDIMFEIIKRKIKCKDTLWLLKNILYSYPGKTNTPIGNLTSQWFGNLYLNELDQWIKHNKKVKDYERYTDDFLVFHDDKNFLRELKERIVDFIAEKLSLRLSKSNIYPVSRGVDFVGYRHFKQYVLVRKTTAKRIKKRVRELPYLFNKHKITLDQYRSSIASIDGWLKWANSNNLKNILGIENTKRKYGWI